MTTRNVWSDLHITNWGVPPFRVMIGERSYLEVTRGRADGNLLFRALYPWVRNGRGHAFCFANADEMTDKIIELVSDLLCRRCHEREIQPKQLGLCGLCFAGHRRRLLNRDRRLVDA